MWMYLVSDSVLLFVLLVSIISGKKNGLIKMILDFFSYIIAFICAWALSPMINKWLSEQVFYKPVYTRIDAAISNVDVVGGVESIIRSVSEKFSHIIQAFHIDMNEIAEGAAVQQENIVAEIAESLSSSVSLGISQAVAFAGIFVAALIVLRFVGVLLNGVAELPIISTVNGFGGAFLGAAKGLLSCWLVVQAGVLVLMLALPELQFEVEQTYFAKMLYHLF